MKMLNAKKNNVDSKIIRFPQRKETRKQSNVFQIAKYYPKVYNKYKESKHFSNRGVLIMDRLQKDVTETKSDVRYLRRDVDELKGDVKNIVTEKLPALQADVAVIKSDVANISVSLKSMSTWFMGLLGAILASTIAGILLYYFTNHPPNS